MPEDLPTPPALCPATTSSMRILYCLRSAEKALGTKIGGFSFLLVLQENQRTDERTRTADLRSHYELVVKGSIEYRNVRKKP